MSATFSTSAFARTWGSPASDRRDASVDAAVARDMARLRQMADAVSAAVIAVRTVGAPVHAWIAGEEFDDFEARLVELIPDVSPAAEAKLREHLMDKAMAGEML